MNIMKFKPTRKQYTIIGVVVIFGILAAAFAQPAHVYQLDESVDISMYDEYYDSISWFRQDFVPDKPHISSITAMVRLEDLSCGSTPIQINTYLVSDEQISTWDDVTSTDEGSFMKKMITMIPPVAMPFWPIALGVNLPVDTSKTYSIIVASTSDCNALKIKGSGGDDPYEGQCWVNRVDAGDDSGWVEIANDLYFVVGTNSPPVVSFSPPSGNTYTVDSVIEFDASACYDPEDQDMTYSWDFNNDGIEDATGVEATYTYTIKGTKDVTLTVSDGTLEASNTNTYEVIEGSTTDYFNINIKTKDKANGNIITDVLCTISDNDEQNTTNAAGECSFTRLTGSEYTIVFTHDDYITSSKLVDLDGGDVELPVELQKKSTSTGYDVKIIAKNPTGNLISDAIVTLTSSIITYTNNTDITGEAYFNDIDGAKYKVKITSGTLIGGGELNVNRDVEMSYTLYEPEAQLLSYIWLIFGMIALVACISIAYFVKAKNFRILIIIIGAVIFILLLLIHFGIITMG